LGTKSLKNEDFVNAKNKPTKMLDILQKELEEIENHEKIEDNPIIILKTFKK
jgi:hypothetical protein